MTSTTPRRSAGVLLHPTSFPGPYGVGDIGPTAYEWIDLLARAKQTWWQILPLGPTGYGDSPYQCYSAFAGNINLLSPELLVRDGLVSPHDLPAGHIHAEKADIGAAGEIKNRLLGLAWDNFRAGHGAALKAEFDDYCGREALWLDDYALYTALKHLHHGASWYSWDEGLVRRDPHALEGPRHTLEAGVGRVKFGEYLFHRQWTALKRYAASHKVRIIGDVPIFVSGDSADVWANPGLFNLDKNLHPLTVAGVPPDYFSEDGQLWGNPHYDWAAMKKDEYRWWIARFAKCMEQVDLVRLDHFRGFEAYWEVTAGSPTARLGRWVPGPGADLLDAVKTGLGSLPLIAEDLGVITPAVEALRDAYHLPGMRILQFAMSDPTNRYLPHHYDRNTAVYTGTHDNDTTLGWYLAAGEDTRRFLHAYLPRLSGDIVGDLIRVAFGSVADYAIIPLQDLLRLPSAARMNTPGVGEGNWGWRFKSGDIRPELVDWLGELTALYSRAA